MEYLIENLEITRKGDTRAIMYGEWSMLFGRYKARIFNYKQDLIFSIKKKVNIWKLSVIYTINDRYGKSFEIKGQNKKHSIYEMSLNENKFELKLHSGHQKSIFKNGVQIAAVDGSIIGRKTKITAKNEENINEIFLMLFCLQIGESNNGIMFNFGNIGKMEPKDENWKP